MATKPGPDPVGPPWSKDTLYDSVGFLEKLTNGVLSKSDNYLSPNEREQVEYAVKALRPAVEQLAECFFEPMRASRSWVADAGYMALLQITQALTLRVLMRLLGKV
ncbi:MAG TPA: hypothetical protein VGG86_12225 [Roseiarcus sp.]